MDKTIGNPLSWLVKNSGATGDHLSETAGRLGREAKLAEPQIRTLRMDNIRGAPRAGLDDFMACRSDAVFAILVYPVAGLVLVGFGLQMNLLPLLFPLIAGFALMGPVAAIGLYELSRRREAGSEANWLYAMLVFRWRLPRQSGLPPKIHVWC